MPSGSIKVILVEDHEITRLGIKKMLEHIPEVTILAELDNGKDVNRYVQELHPDLVLLDIGLPGIDGIEVTRNLKAFSKVKIIVISSHDNEEDVLSALSAGADSYCLKAVTESQLSDAVHSAMDGAVWLDPGIAAHVVNALKNQESSVEQRAYSTQSKRRIFSLSEREKQILSLVVEGMTNQQIADRLFLSVETIKTNMRHILEKLQVPDRMQAALKAVGYGVIPSSPGQVSKTSARSSLNPSAVS